jgi:hypothetical protein
MTSFWLKQNAICLGTVQAINYTGNQSAPTTNAFGPLDCATAHSVVEEEPTLH